MELVGKRQKDIGFPAQAIYHKGGEKKHVIRRCELDEHNRHADWAVACDHNHRNSYAFPFSFRHRKARIGLGSYARTDMVGGGQHQHQLPPGAERGVEPENIHTKEVNKKCCMHPVSTSHRSLTL